jgi:hypothetical protein
MISACQTGSPLFKAERSITSACCGISPEVSVELWGMRTLSCTDFDRDLEPSAVLDAFLSAGDLDLEASAFLEAFLLAGDLDLETSAFLGAVLFGGDLDLDLFADSERLFGEFDRPFPEPFAFLAAILAFAGRAVRFRGRERLSEGDRDRRWTGEAFLATGAFDD